MWRHKWAMFSSSWATWASRLSNLIPTKTQRSHISCIIYIYQSSRGSILMLRWWRQCSRIKNRLRVVTFMNPLTIIVLDKTKELITSTPILKVLLFITKGSSSRGISNKSKKLLIRWGYGKGALFCKTFFIWFLVRWSQLISLPVNNAHIKIMSSLVAYARLLPQGSVMRQII